MKLLHLRIACYLYNQFSDYDDNYLKLSKKYPYLDLNDKNHVKKLIEWLRSWGCRQFIKSYEKVSITSIKDWYVSTESIIPNKGEHLIDYDLTYNKEEIIKIFDDLSSRKAAKRKQGNGKTDVHIGPVGAAKILFALRPNLFSPWDKSIYTELKLKNNGSGYIDYLEIIQNDLREIKSDLKNTKISWDKLFEYLDKKHNSYPKLIDEFYWVTITRGCKPSIIGNFFNIQNA